MGLNLWIRILFVLCVLFAVQALSWALIGSFDPFGIYDSYMASSLWGGRTLSADARRAFAFALILLGATTVGFFVLVALVVKHAFPRRERWAYRAVVGAILTWFTIDTTLSAMAGAWFNILIVNLPCLLLLGIPLAALRRDFRSEPGESARTEPKAG
jgi:hypothetical protein